MIPEGVWIDGVNVNEFGEPRGHVLTKPGRLAKWRHVLSHRLRRSKYRP